MVKPDKISHFINYQNKEAPCYSFIPTEEIATEIEEQPLTGAAINDNKG